MWIQWRAAQKKSARKTRVKRAQKDLKEFTRHAFSVAVPTFLLLRDEDRVNIRRAIQVETFEQGDTIYCEGDDANAFYVVKEGLVTISSSQEGRSERIISSGDPFGAGALESAPRKRVATAIATTQDVLCLRLTRSDWLHTWHAMTDEIAESVFEKLDLEGTGSIERHELEIVLTERWTKDSAADEALLQLVHDVVSSLLVLFDDAGDGRISLAEFKRNLRSVPADDYAATDAGQLSSDAPPLAQACPFQYFHIDPRTEKREPYSSAENEAIFAAHSQDRGSVRLAHPYEVRFGCQAVSKKMQKPAYTGMCQVNLENHNTRIVERANTLDSSNDEATVRLSPSQHSEYVYFHIDPTTNRRCAFTTEDNSKIQAAETEGRAAVKISDVINPHSGETMRFEVRAMPQLKLSSCVSSVYSSAS